MEKNDIFTFKAPNGAEVVAVVVDCFGTCNFEEVLDSKHWEEKYLCYAQNRLFYHTKWIQIDKVINEDYVYGEEIDWFYVIKHHSHEVKTTGFSQKILVDYCVLPDYDTMLENYQHQIDIANDYADKTL